MSRQVRGVRHPDQHSFRDMALGSGPLVGPRRSLEIGDFPPPHESTSTTTTLGGTHSSYKVSEDYK